MDYEAIARVRADDTAYFAGNPELAFRCRRMHACEFKGEAPDGFWAFAIIHRNDVELYWNHVTFAERVWFDCNLTDQQCRDKIHELSKRASA